MAVSSVSVVIPAHNSAPTIGRAIDSALNQSCPPSEIIVVDDCSTDTTADVVAGYATRNVKLLRLQRHRGAGGARNAGIEVAASEVVAFLDSDDEWLQSKLELQMQVLTSSPDITFVACGSNLISTEGVDLGNIYRDHRVVTGENAWKALLAFNYVATPAVIAWRRSLMAVGSFDETLKIGEDQDLWVRLALAGSLGYVEKSLVRVHARENSLSAWSLTDFLTYTIPMIERHVETQRSRLTATEIRQIMGERLARLGRVAYARGAVANGLKLIGRSVILGYRPFESLYYLAAAAPPAMWLRRLLGLRKSS